MLRLSYLVLAVFAATLQACILMPRNEEVSSNIQFTGGSLVEYPGFGSAYVPSRNVEIWLPPSYKKDTTRHYPVLYMHDGQNLFNKTTAFR